ncbi:hypothetical protein LR48_Vigan902s000900 [Vigna angularis]|uniref:Uncharacterized protein n=1 Tax=Phaseolus angularis TaxID=3914 RepID=A0A0L9TI64_PHAAN|nr:hypothetical protein LR48_Vigan902s000900 [Vigna angularis]
MNWRSLKLRCNKIEELFKRKEICWEWFLRDEDRQNSIICAALHLEEGSIAEDDGDELGLSWEQVVMKKIEDNQRKMVAMDKDLRSLATLVGVGKEDYEKGNDGKEEDGDVHGHGGAGQCFQTFTYSDVGGCCSGLKDDIEDVMDIGPVVSTVPLHDDTEDDNLLNVNRTQLYNMVIPFKLPWRAWPVYERRRYRREREGDRTGEDSGRTVEREEHDERTRRGRQRQLSERSEDERPEQVEVTRSADERPERRARTSVLSKWRSWWCSISTEGMICEDIRHPLIYPLMTVVYEVDLCVQELIRKSPLIYPVVPVLIKASYTNNIEDRKMQRYQALCKRFYDIAEVACDSKTASDNLLSDLNCIAKTLGVCTSTTLSMVNDASDMDGRLHCNEDVRPSCEIDGLLVRSPVAVKRKGRPRT